MGLIADLLVNQSRSHLSTVNETPDSHCERRPRVLDHCWACP